MKQRYAVTTYEGEDVGLITLTPDHKRSIENAFRAVGLKLIGQDQARHTYTWGDDTTEGTQEDCEVDLQKYLVNELTNGDIAPVERDDGKTYQIEVTCRLVPNEE